MRKTALLAISFVSALCVMTANLRAGEADTEVGRILLCDTASQVEDAFSLYRESRDMTAAIEAVNAKAGKANACDLGLVWMFERGALIKTIETPGGAAAIYQVTVVGGIHPVFGPQMFAEPQTQFTIGRAPGRNI